MALDDLAVFVAVARDASFAKASRKLAIPTSSVSRAVARLEDALGMSLLRRTSRTVALTDEGRTLLDRAGAHLDGLVDALDTVGDHDAQPTGIVRVTAPAFTGSTRVARVLAEFAVQYPRITIELDATNAIRDLVNDGYDFGIRVGGKVDADFVSKKLWTSAYTLCATAAFKAKHLGKRVTRDMLERVPAVVLRTPMTWRFAKGEVTPNARFVINDPRAAVDVARRGLGLVLAPAEAVTNDLVAIATELGEPRSQDLYVVYPTRRLLPTRVRLAIDWLAASQHERVSRKRG